MWEAIYEFGGGVVAWFDTETGETRAALPVPTDRSPEVVEEWLDRGGA